jgi:hypothetical protein
MTSENENLNTYYPPSPKTGWILVFDLDNTIVGEYSDQRSLEAEEPNLNPAVVEILRKAVDARDKSIVAGIFLLTNNSDYFFAKVVELTLAMRFKKHRYKVVFDYIMPRGHSFRSPPEDDPPKSLREVEYMVKEAGLSTENLANRVIFIDDRATHEIAKEIPKEHYIVITPPFVKGGEDRTDFSLLESLLEPKKGGKRKRTTRKRFRRFQMKTKKSKR